jgi:hypothetical protein
MIEAAKTLALAARREHPIPTDFEHALRRHNVSVSSLKPHLKPPVSKTQLFPGYVDVLPEDLDAYTTLPLLGEELSGQPDKDEKEYVPSSFPDFPSKHTYKFTPQEDTSIRDSKKIREEAARTAQQGEDALRRLVRASKMRKQKEVKNLVERDAHGKERFRLWESTMARRCSRVRRFPRLVNEQLPWPKRRYEHQKKSRQDGLHDTPYIILWLGGVRCYWAYCIILG